VGFERSIIGGLGNAVKVKVGVNERERREKVAAAAAQSGERVEHSVASAKGREIEIQFNNGSF